MWETRGGLIKSLHKAHGNLRAGLRMWIYIHRQRKEWDAREKEMVAYRLVELVGRAGAANILGIGLREVG